MAVISELIDAGLSLKEQGNHQAAIAHFRQLNVTYPDHARIMFELAGSWQAFGVPEQALPLYRRLMAMPKSQGLPPKDMPRLYTQMGATLRTLGQFTESLEIIDEGVSLYPDYRPLRAYRMFALHSAGFHQNAMIEALELMLESLAPTKWDLYENEIIDIVEDIRDRIPEPDTSDLEDWVFDEFWTEEGAKVKPEAEDDDTTLDEVLDEVKSLVENGDIGIEVDDEDETQEPDEPEDVVEDVVGKAITIEKPEDDEDETFEIQVKVIDKKKDTKPTSKKSSSKSKNKGQLGKKAVKINIGEEDADDDEPTIAIEPDDTDADDDKPAPPSGKVNIPIDFD